MKKYTTCNQKNFYNISISRLLIYIFVIGIGFTYLSFKSPINKYVNAYEAAKITYAKAGKDCALYKDQSLSDNIGNIYFYIPETYFVSIISKVSDNAYKVLYGSFTGYCKASELTIANFVPSVSTLLGISFDINSSSGTQVWSLPSDQNSKVLCTISPDTKNIEYIASIIGEIPVGGTTNLWYFARFTPATNSTAVYEGYVYSEATTNLTHIPNNLEVNNEEIFPDKSPVNLNTSLKVIFILLICMPFVILFIIACVKAKKQFKKEPQMEEQKTISAPTPKPTRSIKGQFVKKKSKKPIFEESDSSVDTIEVVFPEYNFVDDDDLL